jgi:ribonuclease P protein component
MGLPRHLRMTRRGEFAAVREGGRAWSGKLLTLAFLEKPPLAGIGIRFGFTLTKKLGNAVERNRLRRRLREIARIAQADGRTDSLSGDLVTIPRRGAVAAEFDALRREWLWALGKLSSLAGKSAGSSGAKGRTSDNPPKQEKHKE